MAFSLFKYLLSFQRYSSFCLKIDDLTNRFSTQINCKIKNISGNIGVILLKLGTNNGSAHSAIRQKEVGHLMLFTQQKSYHFYTTEILFQTEKEVSQIKLVYASIADHLLHSSYPYPLDQRELVDKNDNF